MKTLTQLWYYLRLRWHFREHLCWPHWAHGVHTVGFAHINPETNEY